LHGQPNLQSDPVDLLRAFDANRDRIYGIAPRVYVRDATISSNPTFDVASIAGRGGARESSISNVGHRRSTIVFDDKNLRAIATAHSKVRLP
jgi:hypothetical protein